MIAARFKEKAPTAMALIVVALAIGLLAGCSALENLEREGEAPERRVETARFFMEFEPPPGEELPRDLEGEFTGEITHGGKMARMALDLTSLPGGVPGPDIEFIFTDALAYVRPIADAKTLPRGKSWLLMDAASLEELMPGMRGNVDFLLSDRLLKTYPRRDEDETGQEQVRGIETTRYSTVENVDEMAEVVDIPPEQLEEIRRFTGEDLELTMWLDGDGFMRRIAMPFVGPRQQQFHIVIEAYDLGAPISIELPDEREVAKV